MDTSVDEKPKLEPLPQRSNGQKNQSEKGNDTKPFNQNHNNRQNQQQKRGFGGPRRNNDNNDQRGPNQRNQREGGRNNEEYQIISRLKQLNGPTHEIPSIEQEEVKFSGRNRLYIGNITGDVSEEELKELFKPFGEISEPFINKEKNFAFLKMDFHANAEKAKRELDGTIRKGRQIRIRFAPNATSIKVKNLTPFVSNELLFRGFEIFGNVERAVIIVDDRGKPTGEGIVEFARKNSANAAIKYCSERCFFLTSSLRPCVCELLEHNDETDGYPEKALPRKNQEFFKERQSGPRFAENGSFEHEYGTRWKQLHELYKQKHEALKREMQIEEEKLEAQMEYARYEHETELLREQLRQREMDRDRQKSEWEKKQLFVEELRTKEEQHMRRQQEDMQLRMNRQEEELRRRQQENTLFMQAQQLNSLLDQQEHNQGNNSGNMHGGQGVGGRKFNDQGDTHNRRTYDMMNQNQSNQDSGFVDYNHGQNVRNSRFDDAPTQGNRGGQQNRGGWMNNNRGGDDFQNKRRRY